MIILHNTFNTNRLTVQCIIQLDVQFSSLYSTVKRFLSLVEIENRFPEISIIMIVRLYLIFIRWNRFDWMWEDRRFITLITLLNGVNTSIYQLRSIHPNKNLRQKKDQGKCCEKGERKGKLISEVNTITITVSYHRSNLITSFPIEAPQVWSILKYRYAHHCVK